MEKQITVSMVEDLDDIRERVIRIIDQTPGFLMLPSFSDAEEALAALPELCPDIVLMDINLPGMSGIECIRQIKRVAPSIQFMMFTIYEDNDQVFEALEAGASGYLLKKTPYADIPPALKELHAGGAPMSTHIARKVVNSFRRSSLHNADSTPLSPRETEVLTMLSKGYLYKEIAEKLHISIGTVTQHIHNIYEKLHVQNRTEALNKYYGSKS